MRIIDRYVLSSFIKNYLISFMVLIGLYIAMDMVIHFANLTQTAHGDVHALSSGQIFWDIARFYFFRCFLIFLQLAGIICVVAAAFTLMRFSHFNELTALMAAGMPLLRVSVSIILAGIVLNLVLLPLNQELLIPRMIPELSKDYEDVHLQTARSTGEVAMMPDEKGNLFSAGLYTLPTAATPAHVEELDVIERSNLVPVGHIRAKSAVWNSRKNQWDLTDGHRVDISPAVQATPQQEVPVDSYPGTITPEKILLNIEKSYVQLLPTHRINLLLEHPEAYGHMNLLRAKFMRFAQPIVNVILLLLAIPAVLTRNPAALKTSALKCMGLSAACMGTVFLTFQLAGQPMHAPFNVLWPALMAWLPIFIFGPVSVHMLERIKS